MSGTMDRENPFVEWLLVQLEEKRISREELARRAGVKSTGITNVVNRNKNLGPELARSIARALEMRQRIVFTAARIIDDEGADDAEQDRELEEIKKILSGVKDSEERARIRRVIRTIVREIVR